MKLSELILAIGDENVQMQPLDACMIAARYDYRSGTKITFGTPMALTPNGTERMGLIVWLDRDAVKKAREDKP